MEIPQQVIEAASSEVEIGGKVVYECDYKGEQVFDCHYDQPVVIGMPIFYLWNGERVNKVGGREGLELLGTLNEKGLLQD